MDWNIISATGQWAGAIAVVVTLFYLAKQIQQQNANNDLNLHESILDGFNTVNSQLAINEDLATLFVRGLYTPDKLTDEQATQFHWIFRLYANCYLKIYRLHQKGVISEEDWSGHASHGAMFFNSPGGQLWISSQGPSAFDSFFNELQTMPFDETSFEMTLGRLENWK
jgi:hypothetical protein